MMEKLILSRELWQAMRRHVARCMPLEACGLLGGRDGQVEIRIGIRNADRSPVHFRMEPRAQWRAFQRIEAAGLEIIGIYHSHPNGPDHPSRTDIAEAMYPAAQVIWFANNGKWQARVFSIRGGAIIEITLQVNKPE